MASRGPWLADTIGCSCHSWLAVICSLPTTCNDIRLLAGTLVAHLGEPVVLVVVSTGSRRLGVFCLTHLEPPGCMLLACLLGRECFQIFCACTCVACGVLQQLLQPKFVSNGLTAAAATAVISCMRAVKVPCTQACNSTSDVLGYGCGFCLRLAVLLLMFTDCTMSSSLWPAHRSGTDSLWRISLPADTACVCAFTCSNVLCAVLVMVPKRCVSMPRSMSAPFQDVLDSISTQRGSPMRLSVFIGCAGRGSGTFCKLLLVLVVHARKHARKGPWRLSAYAYSWDLYIRICQECHKTRI